MSKDPARFRNELVASCTNEAGLVGDVGDEGEAGSTTISMLETGADLEGNVGVIGDSGGLIFVKGALSDLCTAYSYKDKLIYLLRCLLVVVEVAFVGAVGVFGELIALDIFPLICTRVIH